MTVQRDKRGERGFTMIEMLIVVIIIATLVVLIMGMMKSAREAARNDSMKTAGASIDQAIGSFNRMHPPVPPPGSTTIRDELIQRSAGQAWSGNTGNPANGLADDVGEWLVAQWPVNPFRPGGVVVRRYSTQGNCTAGGVPGEVRVCRTPAGPMTYMVTAWGKNRDGNPTIVYRATHG